MRFKTTRKIEWGDCDSAGIVDFTSPATYGDIMDIEAWFTKIGRSSCQLGYRLAVEGRTIVEGYEKRVFGKGGAGGMQTVPIPEELRPGLEKYFEG